VSIGSLLSWFPAQAFVILTVMCCRCVYKYIQAGELVERTVKQHEQQVMQFEKTLAETNSRLGAGK
jgi:Zn ribbon nucleic-acid-binding protein